MDMDDDMDMVSKTNSTANPHDDIFEQIKKKICEDIATITVVNGALSIGHDLKEY
jgi:hypothetical protein